MENFPKNPMQQSASRRLRARRNETLVLFNPPLERTSSISRFRGKGQKTNLIWFRLHEDAAPATSFVLNEGRLWSHLRTTRHYTNTEAARIALAHTRKSSYPVCPPFVILSQANHVRRRGCSLVSMHAENRSGGNVDSWPRVLWKYCPIRAVPWGEKVETSVNSTYSSFPLFAEIHPVDSCLIWGWREPSSFREISSIRESSACTVNESRVSLRAGSSRNLKTENKRVSKEIFKRWAR